MNLYRFSPITTYDQLIEAISHMHAASYQLCSDSLGEYLPNAGNVGVFCHYDDEYRTLAQIREELTLPSDNPAQKYYELREPIAITAIDGKPGATYTHLYIRKPDPYRYHVGDIDFYLEPERYAELKASLDNGAKIPGARIFPRGDLDMVELHNPDVDVLAYVSPRTMTEKARVVQPVI